MLRAVAAAALFAASAHHAAAQGLGGNECKVTIMGVVEGVEKLKVSWNPPGSSCTATITDYKVQWKSGNEEWSDSNDDNPVRYYSDLGSGTTSYTIPDLIPGTEYTVRVNAILENSEGQPEDLPSSDPESGKKPLLAQVLGVDATPGEESLAVQWDVVRGAESYRVEWKRNGEDYGPDDPPLVTATSYTIGDLDAGVEYTVRVLALHSNLDPGNLFGEAEGTPLLARVTGVSATPGEESLAVRWDVVQGAESYRVQWKSGGEDYGPGDPPLVTATSYTIGDLDAGVEYTVRVLALPSNPNLPDGLPGEAKGIPLERDTPAPEVQVTGVRVEGDVESLIVSWDAARGADGYLVQWKSGGQGYDPASRQDLATTTRHTIEPLTAGVEYTVRVLATRADTVIGQPSDEETGTPRDRSVPLAPEVRVTGVQVEEDVESLIVSWDAARGGDADGYRVEWKGNGEDYGPDDRRSVTATSYTIGNLIAGVEYTVRVIATRAGVAIGRYSKEETGTPLPLPPGEVRVTGVSVTPGVESLAVSWDAARGADGYRVQWKSGGEGYDPASRQAPATATRHTIEGLAAGVEYTVRVLAARAGDVVGRSPEEKGIPGRRVHVSITDAAVAEGAAAEFPVWLDGPSVTEVHLAWTTEDGTAKAGEDYRAVTDGRVTIPPGERMATLRVRTREDRRAEPAETFRVRLTEAVNARLNPRSASGTGTITDDDAQSARKRALGMVLAGVGRWLAADAVEAIDERSAPSAGASQGGPGGRPPGPCGGRIRARRSSGRVP